MKEFNYTFIIPHKNCPDLLQRCVDSIPERDDVQVIIVDDNSDTDKKPSVDRKGVEVVLLDAEHSKGAGRARNVGLERANGKWLLFADADDFYTDYLSTLLNKYADDETTDIVYLNACMFDENGNITPFKTDKLINNYISGIKGAEMDLRYNLWTPWSRMLKRLVVTENHLFFDNLPAGNDVMFGLKSSKFSRNIHVEKKVTYMYYKPSVGSCTDSSREKMIDSRLALRGNMINFYKGVGYKYNTNFFDIIFNYFRRNKLFLVDAVRLYNKYLKLYHISLLSDLRCFLWERYRTFHFKIKVLKKNT